MSKSKSPVSLWENALVLVLRDLQWLQHIRGGGVGRPYDVLHVLEGGPESLFGDLIFSSESRFFVLELKSSAATISTEWRGHGKEPKQIYAHLQKVARRVSEVKAENRTTDAVDELTICTSLLGHYFLYPETAGDGISLGAVWGEPYLMAMARRSKDPVWNSAFPSNEYALVPLEDGFHNGKSCLSIESLMASDMRVAARVHISDKPNAAYAIGRVGLTLNELHWYLSFLGEAGGDDRTRTLVVDDSGHLFAVVTKFKDFLELSKNIEEKSLPVKPTKKRSVRHESVGKFDL